MTKITVDKALIEQAIEALEVGDQFNPGLARVTLRAALAEPAVEPVATLVDADDECDVTTLIARLDSLFARITPPPYFAAADGRGVGLGGKRWNGNGGFQSVMKPNVAKHGGSHFANIAFLAEIASAWPTLREFIHRRAAPVREPAPEKKGLFVDLIAQHPGLAEELAAMDVPAPVQGPENHFKSACWLRTRRRDENI